MKLPDFLRHGDLNYLRQLMRADQLGDLRLAQSDKRLTIHDLEKLQSGGIDVASLDDVRVLSDGTLAYKDRRVILYIRDRTLYNGARVTEQDLPRYHVVNCQTLREMRESNRIERYVVATRDDGRFNVNFLMRGAPHRSEDRELSVCQNCLAALSWDGFSAQQTREERRRRVTWFSPKAFFAKFPIALLNDDGFETEAGAPLNDYTEDFEKVSARLKAEVHYCCEQCGSDLSHPSLRRYLHAHHVSARRYDNRRENLKVLCVECHSRQPAHGHMAKFPDIEGYRAARSALAGC